MFNKLDHIAIVVKDIDSALKFWEETMGAAIAADEIVANNSIRLTHLDTGDCQVQLVQPLKGDHAIFQWMEANGEGLHHICFYADNFDETFTYAKERHLVLDSVSPHQGTDGKRAFFLDEKITMGIRIEVTGN